MASNSVKRLRELFDPEGKYLMHTFEANPAYLSFYKGLKNHILHAKAVWIYDGEIDLYLEKKLPDKEYFNGQGSSLFSQKQNVDSEKSIRVRCIDFSKWILNSFKKSDYIILKMNIEGAEYAVLTRMIRDGSIDYIDELYIDFHRDRCPGVVTVEEHEKLLLNLKMPLYDWKSLKPIKKPVSLYLPNFIRRYLRKFKNINKDLRR